MFTGLLCLESATLTLGISLDRAPFKPWELCRSVIFDLLFITIKKWLNIVFSYTRVVLNLRNLVTCTIFINTLMGQFCIERQCVG